MAKDLVRHISARTIHTKLDTDQSVQARDECGMQDNKRIKEHSMRRYAVDHQGGQGGRYVCTSVSMVFL